MMAYHDWRFIGQLPQQNLINPHVPPKLAPRRNQAGVFRTVGKNNKGSASFYGDPSMGNLAPTEIDLPLSATEVVLQHYHHSSACVTTGTSPWTCQLAASEGQAWTAWPFLTVIRRDARYMHLASSMGGRTWPQHGLGPRMVATKLASNTTLIL